MAQAGKTGSSDYRCSIIQPTPFSSDIQETQKYDEYVNINLPFYKMQKSILQNEKGK